jgi:hypothetical protein
MKMSKYFIILFVSGLLFGCVTNQTKSNVVAKNCDFVTYKNYKELIDKNPGKIPALKPKYSYFDGYSLLPFGSRDKAVAEAEERVCTSDNKQLLVIYDGEKNYSKKPPRGSIVGGVFYEYDLMPVQFTGTSSDELRAELDVWLKTGIRSSFSGAHLKHLLATAKNDTYKELSAYFLDRVKNATKNTGGNSSAVELYTFYNGIDARDDLVKWIKYHKVYTIKLASYKALIDLGLNSEVENLLENESNADLKKKIGMMLI